ncbi:MAG: FtsX-like permease family protein [Candidatus Kapaibacterium sp.]
MPGLLFKSAIKFTVKHPWQIFLSILGISLGVGVVVSIDIANQSSSRSFELSMESVSGSTTHEVSGGPSGVPDSLYYQIRDISGFYNAAPVIERYITVKSDPDRTFSLLGIDPLAEANFRPYLSGLSGRISAGLDAFLISDNAVLMSVAAAENMGFAPGDTLSIMSGAEQKSCVLAGLIYPEDKKSRLALESVMITDISTAHELLGNYGRLSRIDLIIEDSTKLDEIKTSLPAGIVLESSAARTNVSKQMVSAFNVNLTAMSLLALIVGMFLIYNTMTFSVVRRKTYLGLLRTLGVTKKEIFRLVITEALILGIAGSIIGALLGILLGKAMVGLVTRSINDLYFVLNVREIEIPPLTILKGIVLGIAATFLAALRPAREAVEMPPRTVLSRSVQESSLQKRMKLYLVAGIIAIAAGIAVLQIPTDSIFLSYAGILPLILGFALLTPSTIVLMIRLIRPIIGKFAGSIGKMAARGVESQLSRTGIAVAALAVAVSAAVGVGTMVSSFRGTVVHWLENRLIADIYVSAPSMISRFNDAPFDKSIADSVRKIDDVKSMNLYREFQVRHEGKLIHVLAAAISVYSYDTFMAKEGNREEVWNAFENDEAVLVSEPFAYRNELDIGDSLEIPTDRGLNKFRVAGIYYDYSSDMGLVLMHRSVLKKYWDDRMLSGLAVFAKEGVNTDSLIYKIRARMPEGTQMIVRSNKKLLDESVKVFDRTFIITNVLQLLAIGVAFMGILSALTALQLERARELGILRATGLTPGQLRRLVAMQTGIMGFIAGILALPLGNVLAYALIYLINKRSFGWTLQFEFIPELQLQALLLSVGAALLAGIYPGYKMSKTPPAMALREE